MDHSERAKKRSLRTDGYVDRYRADDGLNTDRERRRRRRNRNDSESEELYIDRGSGRKGGSRRRQGPHHLGDKARGGRDRYTMIMTIRMTAGIRARGRARGSTVMIRRRIGRQTGTWTGRPIGTGLIGARVGATRTRIAIEGAPRVQAGEVRRGDTTLLVVRRSRTTVIDWCWQGGSCGISGRCSEALGDYGFTRSRNFLLESDEVTNQASRSDQVLEMCIPFSVVSITLSPNTSRSR